MTTTLPALGSGSSASSAGSTGTLGGSGLGGGAARFLGGGGGFGGGGFVVARAAGPAAGADGSAPARHRPRRGLQDLPRRRDRGARPRRRSRATIESRRVRGDHGQLGQRQEHADEHPRAAWTCPSSGVLPAQRPRRARRRRGRAGRPAQPGDRVRLPELQPDPAHARAGQRRAAARLRRPAPRPTASRRAMRALAEVGLADARRTTFPPSCPAASSSAWPSPGRWSPTRR